jgi:hypothetical protein
MYENYGWKYVLTAFVTALNHEAYQRELSHMKDPQAASGV